MPADARNFPHDLDDAISAQDEVPGNTTDIRQLNQIEILTLKKHLQNITALQTRLKSVFSITE